jgi:hypothetical protein
MIEVSLFWVLRELSPADEAQHVRAHYVVVRAEADIGLVIGRRQA